MYPILCLLLSLPPASAVRGPWLVALVQDKLIGIDRSHFEPGSRVELGDDCLLTSKATRRVILTQINTHFQRSLILTSKKLQNYEMSTCSIRFLEYVAILDKLSIILDKIL